MCAKKLNFPLSVSYCWKTGVQMGHVPFEDSGSEHHAALIAVASPSRGSSLLSENLVTGVEDTGLSLASHSSIPACFGIRYPGQSAIPGSYLQ